jgi:hypothetical protein
MYSITTVRAVDGIGVFSFSSLQLRFESWYDESVQNVLLEKRVLDFHLNVGKKRCPYCKAKWKRTYQKGIIGSYRVSQHKPLCPVLNALTHQEDFSC